MKSMLLRIVGKRFKGDLSNLILRSQVANSNLDVELRAIGAIDQVLEKYRGKRTAIGIHGCIMTIIMGHYDPQFDVHFLRNLPKPDIYKLTFRNDKYAGTEKIGTFGA